MIYFDLMCVKRISRVLGRLQKVRAKEEQIGDEMWLCLCCRRAEMPIISLIAKGRLQQVM